MAGKVVLVGSTAAAMSDFRATSTNHLYPGVEVHANMIEAIISNRFLLNPTKARVTFTILLIAGLMLAILLPLMSPGGQVASLAAFLASVLAVDYWLWITQLLVINVVPALLTIVLLKFNPGYGFILSSRNRLQLKAMFGQYSPAVGR